MLIAILLALDAESVATAEERAGIEPVEQVRLSLPTEEDVDAWARPGFKVQLGAGIGNFARERPALAFATRSVYLRPSVRLDERWSIAATFSYGLATGVADGQHWSATLEPVFHPWRGFGLAVGLGYGGFDAQRPPRSVQLPNFAQYSVSRTLTSSETMYGCEGGGLAALARAEYLFVAGPLFSTGPFVQGAGQWTRCSDALRRIDRETGLTVAAWQWWRNHGWAAGWTLAWR